MRALTFVLIFMLLLFLTLFISLMPFITDTMKYTLRMFTIGAMIITIFAQIYEYWR